MALHPCFINAQVTLSQNMYQVNDLLERLQIAPTSIRECPDAMADLQHMEAIGSNDVRYTEWGADSLISTDNAGMLKFRLRRDSLFLAGTENRLMHIDYALPEIWLRFPMCLGDSIGGLFEGKGQYCERLFIRKAGRYSTKADALGSLVTENCDTVRNVLRLRSERITATLAQPLDSMLAAYGILDSVPLLGSDSITALAASDGKAIRTVTLRYYVPGCRYPVLETSETESVVENSTPVQAVAFYSSPFSQAGLVSANRGFPETSSEYPNHAPLTENTGNSFSYSLEMNTSSQTITVNCSTDGETLMGNSSIRLLLCDQQGILYRQASGCLHPGERESLSVSYAGLRHGQYLLYIEACGKQYAEKFSVN
jgi:hypothetical protein